jgi:hypothetical protein
MFLLFLIAAIMTIVVSEIAGVNYDFAEDDNENGGNSYDFAEDDNENGGNSYDFAEDDNENGDDSPEESNGGKKKEDGCKIDYC